MNVVIYARYSSDRQREESIEGQLKVCYDYAEKEGYNVIDTYIDRALSAKTDNRPKFQQMIRDSGKKQFQGIIVYQLDRFARNRADSAKYRTILNKNNVKLFSANENISDNASGILLESVIEGLAEYYSVELSEKVTRGMNVNAEKGLYNGGVTPLGYKIENHKYVIDEEKAPIVKEIFTKYANGERIVDICKDLNSRGLTNAQGTEFKANSFSTLLKNRRYLGLYIYKGKETPNIVPQIIDEELFNKVAEKLAKNKLSPARARAKAEYILTTKLFCGYCKEMMVGHSSNKVSKGGVIYNYYKCKNSGRKKSCHKKMVMKDYIEDVVINECRKLLTPNNIKEIAKQVVKVGQSYDDKTELNRLNKLLQQNKEEKDNQMLSLRLCKSDVLREMIFEDLEKIGSTIKELERQIEIEKSRHYVITEKQVIDFLTSLSTGNSKDIRYRKTLIKVLVNKIFLYDDRLTITFNSGDDEVTINDLLLEDIEKQLHEGKVCLLNNKGYQKDCNFKTKLRSFSMPKNYF